MKKVIALCCALLLAGSMAGCYHAQYGADSGGRAADGQRGHFEDVYRWDGAVVGTRYEEATEEIKINASKENDKIVVELVLLYPEEFPYREIILYGLESYRIVDAENKVVKNGETTELAAGTNGKLSIPIPLDDLEAGAYRLIVSEIVASNLAEDPFTNPLIEDHFTNPLIIAGEWECEFTW